MSTLKEKAGENLDVSRSLLDAAHLDSAMSRLYYALFQAAVHSLRMQGKTPAMLSADADTWTHTTVRNNASLCRGRRADRDLLGIAFSLRQQADYKDMPVKDREVRRIVPEIEAFVKETCT